MRRLWRELALVAIVAALMLAFSVQLRRAEPLPTPRQIMAFIASLPPPITQCRPMGFPVIPTSRIGEARPLYPLGARHAHVSGVVILQADIDEDGHISNAHVIRSVPLLDQAALDTVGKWRFEPGMLRGTPVCVTMTLAVNFQPE